MAAVRHRFPALDWLRGIAAISVLIFHFASVSNPGILPHGGLAVDFFFSLSGFVVSFAYGDKLRNGMPVVQFAQVRFIRLYPMIALGVLIGAFGYARSYPPEQLIASIVSALLLLPSPFGSMAEGFSAVPANPPEWTLIFEFYGNLIYAVAAPRLTSFRLALLIAVSLLLYEISFIAFGPQGFGFSWPTIIGGIPRFSLSFSIGIALYRLQASGINRTSLSLLGSTCALVAVFCIPCPSRYEWAYSSASILVFFPAIILLSANIEVRKLYSACTLLGELSYPAYILQGGFVPHAKALADRVGHGSALSVAIIGLLVVIYLCATFAVWKVVDVPIRKALTGRTRRPQLARSTGPSSWDKGNPEGGDRRPARGTGASDPVRSQGGA